MNKKEKVILDGKKLKSFFDSAIAKLILESPDSEIDRHKVVVETLSGLEKYSLGEQLILLAAIMVKVYSQRENSLSGPENLEAISYAVFQSLRRSQNPGDLMFIIGRISERTLRLFPKLAETLDREMNKILSGKVLEPGYIS